MPYQIKNGIIYSGNAVTLTQAQYDALTTAEKNNGTVYYIYDSDAMIEAQEVGLDGGNVEDLAGSVATIEASPATANHEVGEYILWNGVLYTVTSAIATGENLVVNSNISATTVGSELTALNAGLTCQLFTSFVGSHALNLPSEFNELYIFASVQAGGNSFSRTMYLIKNALPDTYQYYYSGDSGGRISAHISKTAIDTIEYYDDSTNYTAQTTFNIYYR